MFYKHKMRKANCSPKLCANVVIVIHDERKCLTIFEDCITELVGDFDHASVDTDDVGDKLMNLNNSNSTVLHCARLLRTLTATQTVKL